MKFIILGCGSSMGVPRADGLFGKCDPKNKKNYRTRCSALLKTSDENILIDSSPDLRQQLLNAKVKYLDAVLITHTHADHINGIDDFRFLNVLMKKDINLYATKEVLEKLNERFGYVFEKLSPEAQGFYYKPCLIPNEISGEFVICLLYTSDAADE